MKVKDPIGLVKYLHIVDYANIIFVIIRNYIFAAGINGLIIIHT